VTSPAAAAAAPPEVSHARIEVGATIAGLDVAELTERYGSPLYVYDAGVIRHRVARLRSALPATVDIAFAVKANPSPAVLSTLRSTGVGADVASGGELRAVLRAGFDPEWIVFTGPGKTDAELEAALRARIGTLTIESLDELEVVIDLAAVAEPGQGLMLRLATSGAAEERPVIGGAGSAKFGLTDEEADAALDRLVATGLLGGSGPYVLRGCHAFGASNLLDAGALVGGVVDLAARAERLASRHGLVLELIDAGGGLGIPYADDDVELDLDALAQGLEQELATWASRDGLRRARLLLEPGRWLVGPAGAYVCRVTRTKPRQGRVIAVTDGGIHHLMRPRLVGQDHRVQPLGAASTRPIDARMDVVGPLCTGLDILASDVPAPVPQAGDLLAVLDAGAYGYSESMPLFLSHPIPAEIVVDGGQLTVSRERIEPD